MRARKQYGDMGDPFGDDRTFLGAPLAKANKDDIDQRVDEPADLMGNTGLDENPSTQKFGKAKPAVDAFGEPLRVWDLTKENI